MEAKPLTPEIPLSALRGYASLDGVFKALEVTRGVRELKLAELDALIAALRIAVEALRGIGGEPEWSFIDTRQCAADALARIGEKVTL